MISYYSEDTSFVQNETISSDKWLNLVIERENRRMGDIAIIFCSDPYLLDVNRKFLQHDYYTDIITFDYCHGDIISGDLFISVDSVRDNSVEFGTGFDNELNRVMVHGILHLIGYDDHTDEDVKVMRHKENFYLDLLKEL